MSKPKKKKYNKYARKPVAVVKSSPTVNGDAELKPVRATVSSPADKHLKSMPTPSIGTELKVVGILTLVILVLIIIVSLIMR